MRRNLSQLNRKAVSLMVGYVLLIAIAVALSTAVFFYLKLYLPDERPECDTDIKLTIDYASCVIDVANASTSSIVNINVTNRGLFKVEGAYIKIGDVGREFKEDLNPTLSLTSNCNNLESVLNPGKIFCGTYSYNAIPTVPQEISVQPVIWVNNEPVLCSEAVATRRVVCLPP